MKHYRVIKDVPELGEENIGKKVILDPASGLEYDGVMHYHVQPAVEGETFSTYEPRLGVRANGVVSGYMPLEWLEEVL